MNIQFTDKVVVITGAGGGIGNSMAKGFAEDGAIVCVCDIKGAEKTVDEIIALGGKAKAYELDVTDRESAKSALKAKQISLGALLLSGDSNSRSTDLYAEGASNDTLCDAKDSKTKTSENIPPSKTCLASSA